MRMFIYQRSVKLAKSMPLKHFLNKNYLNKRQGNNHYNQNYKSFEIYQNAINYYTYTRLINPKHPSTY